MQQQKQVLKQSAIRRQLMFLLHASKCIQHEKENFENLVKCSDANCERMKKVLSHLAKCKIKECKFPHCRSSKMIIFHWKICKETNCNICLPFGKRKQYLSAGDIETSSSEVTSQNMEAKENLYNAIDTATASALATENQIMLEQQNQEVSSFEDLRGTQIENNDQVPQEQNQMSGMEKNVNVFTTEMKHALLTLLDKLLAQEPESIYFRTCIKSQAKDKKSIDLITIRYKLMCELYEDPWEYINDVWFMFSKAWLCNSKNSAVYQQCTKLSNIFEQEIDSVMQSFGYCCGKKHKFKLQKLQCDSNKKCEISTNAIYYSYENSSKIYIFCKKCFKKEQGKITTIIESGLGRLNIKKIEKTQFKKMKNSDKFESFVECLECGRKQHQICVLYLEKMWPDGFICDNCLKKKNIKRMENKFKAKYLPKTKLGNYIETRVNNFLKEKKIENNKVYIRVVLCSDEIVKVQTGMHNNFVKTGKLPSEFPYRKKMLFAFQEIDGIDVCFFGMDVQEYNSECPLPNNRRVYISYLDSVKFFNPQKYRTDIYYEILLSYLNYVKNLGYTMAHIWSCPPLKGIDFIFYCHPPDQKIPKSSRLKKWYENLLKEGVRQNAIYSFKTFSDKYIIENEISSVTQLPYFKNDYLSTEFEVIIKILSEQNNNQENKNESNEQQETNDDDLNKNILENLGKTREIIFMINLHSSQSAVNLGPIQDPDPLIYFDLMDNRDTFLDLSRNNNYEFSSLRRAKFSTLWMLYELHNVKLPFICDNCATLIENPFHCTICKDFDLCTDCVEKVYHPHEMKKLNINLKCDLSLIKNKEKSSQKTPELKIIENCIQSLIHAQQCKNINCYYPSCRNVKKFIERILFYKQTSKDNYECFKILSIVCSYHAKHCIETECPVPFCSLIKKEHKQREFYQRLLFILRGCSCGATML